MDVRDAGGNLVRHLTSIAPEPVPEATRPPEPNFWIAPPFALPKNAGANRSNWDLRYDSPNVFSHSFEINANPGLTPASPLGPLVLPGTYTLTLTANGVTSKQTVIVTADPRSPATSAALAAQHALQMKILQGINASFEGHRLALALHDALQGAVPAGAGAEYADARTRVTALVARLDTIGGLDAPRRRGRGGAGNAAPNFQSINGAFAQQLTGQEWGDNAPPATTQAAFTATCRELTSVWNAWTRLASSDLGALNSALTARGRQPVSAAVASVKPPVC
jgi:hypothetical protein